MIGKGTEKGTEKGDKKGVFIFRRDFRINDNYALIALAKECDEIVPIFIFDPYQIEKAKHNVNYFSDKSVKFMIESLDDLNEELKTKKSQLNYFYGNPAEVIEDLIKKNSSITHVAFNLDFSPYSKIRDAAIMHVCEKSNIICIVDNQDLLLHPIDKVVHVANNLKKPFTVFGHYFKNAMKYNVEKPRLFSLSMIKKLSRNELLSSKYNTKKIETLHNSDEVQKGGRKEAIKILKSLKDFRDYSTDRDLLNYQTTRLSAHLKFGTISIREVYDAIKNALGLSDSGKSLIRQLYWRNFYFVLANYRTTMGGDGYGHIEKRFKKLKWTTGQKLQQYGRALWQDGSTGFPMIDACIRQLNTIGWMHNRGRLMVASFAVKILHIDPFAGGKWSCQEAFSRKLVDCCYANNFGNWMWILGPYDPGGYRYGRKGTFSGRVFKDVVNFKVYDPKLEFIRKWIPELKDVPDKDVLEWHLTGHKKYPTNKYSKPIVDFEKQLEKWYNMTLVKTAHSFDKKTYIKTCTQKKI